MSMMGRWVEISPELLAEMQRDETVVERLVAAEVAGQSAPGKMDAVLEKLASRVQTVSQAMPPEIGRELLEQLQSMRANMTHVGKSPAPEGVRRRLDLDKAWHGVHFLMCGTSREAEPPLGNAVLGGLEIGPDNGYGPARYLAPAEVAAIADAMGRLDEATIRSRCNPTSLEEAQLYPGGWDDEHASSWLLKSLQELRDFYSQAAGRGSAVLLYLT